MNEARKFKISLSFVVDDTVAMTTVQSNPLIL